MPRINDIITYVKNFTRASNMTIKQHETMHQQRGKFQSRKKKKIQAFKPTRNKTQKGIPRRYPNWMVSGHVDPKFMDEAKAIARGKRRIFGGEKNRFIYLFYWNGWISRRIRWNWREGNGSVRGWSRWGDVRRWTALLLLLGS